MPWYRNNSSTATSSIGRTITANATIAASDMGTTVLVNSASDVVLTLDTNASVPMPDGAFFEILNIGTGNILLSPAPGVTALSRGLGSIGSMAGVSVLRLSADNWHVAGEMITKSGIEYQAYTAYSDTTELAQHTFNNVSIGSPQTNRKILLIIGTASATWSQVAQIDSVTINGVSATIHGRDYFNNAGAAIALVGASIAVGSTATVVVNCTATVRCVLSSYAVYTSGALLGATVDMVGSSTASVSTSADAGDLVIGCGYTMRPENDAAATTRFTLSQVAPASLDANLQVFGWPLNMALSSRSINGAASGTVTAASASNMNLSSASIIRWAA